MYSVLWHCTGDRIKIIPKKNKCKKEKWLPEKALQIAVKRRQVDWLDFLAVQGTLKSLLQHQRLKASILWCSTFFMVQLSHPYMTTGKTIALTRQTFVGKVISLLLNMLSRLVITFLPRSKHLLILWLQLPSAVILESPKIKVWHYFHCFPIYFPWVRINRRTIQKRSSQPR